MKYTKPEQQAIDDLLLIAQALKQQRAVKLTAGRLTNISNQLGISFLSATKKKTDAENAGIKKNKDAVLLAMEYYNLGRKYRYCYFPFQLKG